MNIEIANRLTQLRKENNLSQEELAAKIGVSRQAISNWERGEASPDTDNLILLAQIYQKTIDEIVTGKTAPESEASSDASPEDLFRDKKENSSSHEPAKTDRISEEEFTYKPDWMALPYPLICTIIFLLLGFCFDAWHPAWMIFLTIPIVYAIFPFLRGNRKYRRK